METKEFEKKDLEKINQILKILVLLIDELFEKYDNKKNKKEEFIKNYFEGIKKSCEELKK